MTIVIKRRYSSLTHGVEKKILNFLAKRIYKLTTADQLTSFAFLGTFVIFFSLIKSSSNLLFLHLANFGVFMHWFGDSLDGRVARLRKEARPLYGHYLDHILDIISVTLIFLGIHLSGLAITNIWIYTLIIALLFASHIHLRTGVTGIFTYTFDRIGTTEIRIIFILINLIVIYTKNPIFSFEGTNLTLIDTVGFTSLTIVSYVFIKNIIISLWGSGKIKG